MMKSVSEKIVNKLLTFDIFKGVTKESISKLITFSKRFSFQPDETILPEGKVERQAYFYIILSGDLQVKRRLNNSDYDKNLMINILMRGDSFGEIAILADDRRRTSSIKALTKSSVLAIQRSSFLELYNCSVPFLQNMHRLAIQNLNLSNSLTTYAMLSSKNHTYKLSYLLNFLSTKYGKTIDNRVEINLPFNVSIIAQFLGVAKQQFNRSKKKLKDKGLIGGYGKQITILDYREFKRFLDRDENSL